MAEFTYTFSVSCPSCQSDQVIKKGQRNGEQNFGCKACGKKFRLDKAEGRKFSDEQMGIAVRLYYSGVSYQQLAEMFRDFFNINIPSKRTFYRWVSEFTDKAVYMLKDVKAQTGDKWVADEMYISVGGRKLYHWNVMDAKTRYLLASYLSPRRDMAAAIKVFQMALARADHPPARVVTDKYDAYPRAIHTVIPGAKHIRSKGAHHAVNNNLSERMQGNFRSREKTLRGMDSIESAQRFLDGYVVTYNHIRDHSGVKERTPALAAKIDVPISEWADIVKADVEVPPEARTAHRTRIYGNENLPRDLTERKRLQRRKRRAAQKAKKEANRKTSKTPVGIEEMFTKNLKESRASRESRRRREKLSKEGKLHPSTIQRRSGYVPGDGAQVRINFNSTPSYGKAGRMHRNTVEAPKPEMPVSKPKPRANVDGLERRMNLWQGPGKGVRSKPPKIVRHKNHNARQPQLL